MLEVANVYKRFGGLRALSDVAFTVREGTVLGLIGPNGAGKTTLFNIMTGFHTPNQGAIRYRGEDITRFSPERRNRIGIARTFQVIRPFPRLTVEENVLIGAYAATRVRRVAKDVAMAALETVGLFDRAGDLPGNLTLAARKRMELARCLASKPKLLLLDEVMCGLNPTEMAGMTALISRLRAEGLTLVIVEHIMQAIVDLADEVVVLSSGQVIAHGPPLAVLNDSKVVEAYLGEAHGSSRSS